MLTKLPLPSTNNLYQFFASIGITMAVTGVAGAVYLQGQLIDLHSRQDHGFIDRLNRLDDRLVAESGKRPDAKLEEVRFQLIRERYEAEDRTAAVEYATTIRRTRQFLWGLSALTVWGLILASWGLIRWYQTHQLHQDALAELETEHKRRQNAVTELEAEKLRAEIQLLAEQLKQSQQPTAHDRAAA